MNKRQSVIRQPSTREDVQRIKDIWKYSFSETEQETAFYFTQVYNNENTLLIEDEQGIAASLQMNPNRIVRNVRVYDASYIVGVSVAPESRGKGYSSLLMKASLEHLYEKGDTFCLLMPIDTRIYLRYGFINCFDIEKLSFSLDQISVPRSQSNVELPQSITPEIGAKCEAAYRFAASSYGVYQERDLAYYERKLKEVHASEGYFVTFENEEGFGYMLFFPHFSDTGAFIQELTFTTPEIFHSMIHFLLSHRTQFQKAELASPNFNLIRLLRQYDNTLDWKKEPFVMARVLHAEHALGEVVSNILVQSQSGKEVIYRIRINDPYIEQNNATFLYDQDFRFLGKKPHSFDDTIVMDISTLTLLYFGIVSPITLAHAGKLQSSHRIEWNKEFQIVPTFFNEYV